jgi:GMP synthase-like glutamine amidotransferase
MKLWHFNPKINQNCCFFVFGKVLILGCLHFIMILVVNVCRETLHYHEFVSPILNILNNMSERYYVVDYDKIDSQDLKNADKIIICGTSLYDNEYLENIDKFSWICDFERPIFGICAGCQLIQIVFGGELSSIKEIGATDVCFNHEFLGVSGNMKVYSLHQNYVKSDDFEVFARSDLCGHAFRHIEKSIYGVLFHPEVYNHEIIENFCRL